MDDLLQQRTWLSPQVIDFPVSGLYMRNYNEYVKLGYHASLKNCFRIVLFSLTIYQHWVICHTMEA
jgi:hypothetical protein